MTIQQDIDKLFKKGLSDYSEKPPGFVWDNIDRKLGRRRLRRKRNLMYSLVASIALLFSFGAGYMFTGFQPSDLLVVNQDENPPMQNFNEQINSGSIMVSDEKNSVKKEQNSTGAENQVPKIEVNSQQNVNTKLETPLKSKTKKLKSSIKKVNSSGTLLPPMFASSNEYEEEIAPLYQEEDLENAEISISNMEMKSVDFLAISNKRELNYDYRQITPLYENTLAVNTEKKASPWAIGMSAAPLISYRNIVDVNSDMAMNADINTNYTANYSNEKPLVSYSAGVNVNYKIAKRWKIQSGIYISELGQISQDVAINEAPSYIYNTGSYDINTSTGNVQVQGSPNELIAKVSNNSMDNSDALFAPPASANDERVSPDYQMNFVQTYEYYEVPVVVNYTFIDRKLSMNVSGGLSANILYGNNTYARTEGNSYELDAETQDLKDMNYSGVFGIGMEYPIFAKLKFNFQPTMRYSLSPINTSGSVYPYSFGLYTGLKYSF